MKQLITAWLSGFLSLILIASPAYANSTDCLSTNKNQSIWTILWGKPAPEPRLYLGMWSVHATKKKRNNHNELLGFGYDTFTAGTFVNSYYKRAYAVGIQRYVLTGPLKHNINYELGYRLGLVSGYKGHDLTGIPALRNSPIIPYVQLVFGLNWKYIGWEVSAPDPYVISTGFYIRF